MKFGNSIGYFTGKVTSIVAHTVIRPVESGKALGRFAKGISNGALEGWIDHRVDVTSQKVKKERPDENFGGDPNFEPI